MASKNITRKTLASSGIDKKKLGALASKEPRSLIKATPSPLKTVAKSVAKSAGTANKLVKSAARTGAKMVQEGVRETAKTVSNATKSASKALTKSEVAKLANKASRSLLEPSLSINKKLKKVTRTSTPRSSGASASPSLTKTSSKLTRKYY